MPLRNSTTSVREIQNSDQENDLGLVQCLIQKLHMNLIIFCYMHVLRNRARVLFKRELINRLGVLIQNNHPPFLSLVLSFDVILLLILICEGHPQVFYVQSHNYKVNHIKSKHDEINSLRENNTSQFNLLREEKLQKILTDIQVERKG